MVVSKCASRDSSRGQERTHFLVVSITRRITLVVRDFGVFRGQHVTAQAVAALGHGHDGEVLVYTYWLTRAGALVDV